MSVRQTIKRHFKIISLLKLRPMSYDDVQHEMKLDPDSIEEKTLTSQRTFQRDILDIASIYGIEIESNRSNNEYYIKNNIEDLHSQRLRENFEILNAIKISKGLGDSLIFEERRPLGTEHMAGLLYAIQNNFVVKFEYHKFLSNSKSQRCVKPIALKEARNRWYLIAQDEEIIKNFGLDRISDLCLTEKKFKPVSYNIYENFKDSFGVISGTDEAAIKVVLSFTAREGRYIESLPLHHSQELLVKNEKEIQFSYFIKPTYDFRMELLSYGDQVKILEPASLRNDIKNQLKEALKTYD
jgi:predicted DNA-binding transcriptional regulator YafY